MPSKFKHSPVCERDQQVENLFGKAVQVEPEKRAAFLFAECGGDQELRVAVTELLNCHQANEESGFILDQPAVPFETNRPDTCTAQIAEFEGDIIGRYRLLEKIGEGGMGVVYMAEQLEDVQRRVALKIIKLGLDTRQFIARFETERQAMTMFDHPNIARVLDAGATKTGRPYLVMELVLGVDILKFVSENKLGFSQRLELFISVCQAIQHSHQKSIVHRDLKPSNIMVSMIDGVAVPKVIDFGVAKALHHRLTDRTLFTQYASIIGTPQYMSPEQAELGADIDTRSDIYSLGVLLYELTTGSTPLERHVVERLHPIALLDTIRQHHIEMPSKRMSKQGSAKRRDSLISAGHDQRVGHELDCIVMKAVAHERSRRYPSANELAADIQRLLDGVPVEAVAPTYMYHLRSYLRRNRKAVIAAVAVVGLLIISSLVCSVFAWNAYQANRTKDETVVQLAKALRDLEVKHERLIVADSTIRVAAEGQTYHSVVKFALMKFRWEYYLKISHLLPTYSNQGSSQFDEDDLPLDRGTRFVQMVPHEYLDLDVLFDLENRDLCKTELARLQACAKNLSLTEQPNRPEFESNEGSIDANLKTELAQIAIQCRSMFFRILLKEHRIAIGDQNPKIARTLNLLALSLLDSGQNAEAEVLLGEAMEISTDDSTLGISRAIMQAIQSQ